MKRTIKKYSSNILGMYKVCDDKGHILYCGIHESVGKFRLYREDQEIGRIEHMVDNDEERYEFYENEEILGKLIKEPTLKKTRYYLSFVEGEVIPIHYYGSDYRILNAKEDWLMKFIQEPSFEAKQYDLEILNEENEILCILIAFALIMAM